MAGMLQKLLHLRLAVVMHDVVMTWLAWVSSYAIRYSIWPESPPIEFFAPEVLMVVGVQALVAHYFNLYRGLWRFASIPDLWNIARAALVGTLFISLGFFLFNRLDGVPRSVLLMYPVLLMLCWGVPRISYRMWKDHRTGARAPEQTRVLLVGAGELADLFIRNATTHNAFRIVGIVDDKKNLHGTNLRGVKIHAGLQHINALCLRHQIDLLVISRSNPNAEMIRAVVDQARGTQCRIRVLPDPSDLEKQDFRLNMLKPLTVDDLLGREKVDMDWQGVAEYIKNKSVLVTGGGGSIGAGLCRQIAQFGVSKLTILDHSEYNLYAIEKDLADCGDLVINAHLCNITNQSHLYHIFNQAQPDIVFHAAAYKHVPLLEELSCEAFINNVTGTRRVADTCAEFGVAKMVLISTDKAVNPFSVMGATKRVAEKYCQYMNQTSDTDYLIVRFGNVLGSAGSVVPLFSEQIERGGPVTVTHPDITRYFMTIEEACQLILQGLYVGERGQIMVLDMGQAVNIRTLAERMIALSGKSNEVDIVYTGLRSGEKLTEELFYAVEELNQTKIDKIHTVSNRLMEPEKLIRQINEAHRHAERFDAAAVMRVLKRMVPEFVRSGAVELIQDTHAS